MGNTPLALLWSNHKFCIHHQTTSSAPLVEKLASIEQVAHIHPWSEKIISECFAERYIVLILRETTSLYTFADENICGYAIFDYVLDEATLQNICIVPSKQGQHLGHILLTEALAYLKKRYQIKKFFLEVRESNIKAINLYKNVGFAQDCIRKKYYHTPDGLREDAWCMSLTS